MENLPRISTPLSEPWIAWLMLGLLGLILFANAFQPGLIRNSFVSLFNIKERDSIFSTASFDIRAQICNYIFKIITLALTLYVIVNPDMTFRFSTTLLLCLLVIGVLLLKIILSIWVATTFFNISTFASCYRHYANFTTAAAICFFPILLLAFFIPALGHTTVVVLCGIIGIFLLICLIIKLFRLFFTKIFVCFYILLYLCSLEILPLAGALFLSSKIVMG